jgi:hypothetical protein
MPTPESCLVLRKAGNDQLVITADFAATGRTTATFHDLAGRLSADCSIWEIGPVPYGQEPGFTGAGQVDRWIRDIRDSGLNTHAVIGFCGGNAYAAALAERIGEWQPPPRLILLDPGIPTPTMMVQHVEGWLRRFASSFSAAQLDQAQQELQDIAALGDQPLAMAAELGDFFGRVISPGLIRFGNSPKASDDFAKLVTGYLYWLAGAIQLDPRPLWRTAPALNSNSPGFGLFLAPPQERATLVGSAQYFDVPHADLMRTDEVAAAVDELLS